MDLSNTIKGNVKLIKADLPLLVLLSVLVDLVVLVDEGVEVVQTLHLCQLSLALLIIIGK